MYIQRKSLRNTEYIQRVFAKIRIHLSHSVRSDVRLEKGTYNVTCVQLANVREGVAKGKKNESSRFEISALTSYFRSGHVYE